MTTEGRFRTPSGMKKHAETVKSRYLNTRSEFCSFIDVRIRLVPKESNA
jgi:hypothetical protein